ncbi:hypothetical protein ACFFRN_27450 [Nonomuraea roseola]|uniref:Uncharacterized protein n=1 Tax=Nonomuraea roseola TaxID=46179 RepID=A0ABV5Q4D2_9ACTN
MMWPRTGAGLWFHRTGDPFELMTSGDLGGHRRTARRGGWELPQRDLGGLLPTWDDLQDQITLARATGAAVPDMMDTHVRAQYDDRVGRADHPADLGVEVEEGHERGSGVLLQLHDRQILTAPDLGEFVEPLEHGGLGRAV